MIGAAPAALHALALRFLFVVRSARLLIEEPLGNVGASVNSCSCFSSFRTFSCSCRRV